MVASKLAITIVMTLVLSLFINESEIYGAEITPFSNQKVNLSIYYESLSHSCATFIVKNLVEIFNNYIINIVNLQLIPWANSHVNIINNSISCRNGPDECELNTLEACALNVWPDVNKQYGLITCLEFLAIDGRSKMWLDCFSQLGLPKEPILNCFNKGNGNELGQKYINETAKLYPPHSFVPWVLVNNQPIGKDYANFTHYVCKAYKGVSVPAACKFQHNKHEHLITPSSWE